MPGRQSSGRERRDQFKYYYDGCFLYILLTLSRYVNFIRKKLLWRFLGKMPKLFIVKFRTTDKLEVRSQAEIQKGVRYLKNNEQR